MRETLYVLLALLVVGALEGGYYLIRFLRDRRRDELTRRLRTLGEFEGDAAVGLLRAERLSSIPALDSFLRSTRWAPRLELLLEQADVNLTVARLIGYSGCGLGLGALIGSMVPSAAPLGILLASVGASLPTLVVFVRRSHRSAKVSEQLPDALEMMARSLRAGHAISRSFQFVAHEMPEPISVEFGRAYEEQRLGRSLEQSVVRMAQRVPRNADLNIFAVSVNVQRETGGNLAEILDKIAETIRMRYRFFGKLRALTAEGRMSGMVLGALPICMAAFLAVSNPDYLRSLFETPLGNGFLAYAFTSWGVGLAWMFRMTKVEF